MIQTGIVTGSKYEKNRDGSREVLMLQVRLSSKNDVQSVEFMQGAFDSYRPANGVKVLVIENGAAYKIAVAADDMTLIQIKAGERAIRSVINGEVKASVLCKDDGDLVLNGGTDFAVKFNELQSKLNALVLQIQNHVHPTPAGPSSVSATVFNGDIATAKAEKVRV